MTAPSALTPIIRLALTGGWGPLAMNTPLDEITGVWGTAPVDQPIRKRHAWPRLLSYGDVEVCACTCRRVSLICIQTWGETVDLPQADDGQLLSLPGNLAYDTVTAALTAADCPWTADPQLTLPGQRTLRAGPFDTSFVFEIFDDGAEVLNMVGLHHPLHQCGPATPAPDATAVPGTTSSPP